MAQGIRVDHTEEVAEGEEGVDGAVLQGEALVKIKKIEERTDQEAKVVEGVEAEAGDEEAVDGATEVDRTMAYLLLQTNKTQRQHSHHLSRVERASLVLA